MSIDLFMPVLITEQRHEIDLAGGGAVGLGKELPRRLAGRRES